MNIILDTNIFRNDFFLKSQDFEVLKDYLKKTDSKLIVPQIILEELKGLYIRTLNENLANLEKNKIAINQNLNRSFIEKFELDLDEEVTKYIEFIKEKLEINDSNIIAYKNEYLPEIIKRAINREKPFRDGDEGFRDSIIWLTILDHCKISHEKQVVFISNNVKDFGDINNKNTTELHQTLKEECDNFGIKVNYFRNPKDFIERHSNKIDLINYDWLSEKLDEDWLSDVVCEEIGFNKSYRLTSWFERKTSNESTEHYTVIKAHFYEYDNLFLYEMVDGRIVVNFTANAEVEVEFEYYEYDYYGRDSYYGYRNAKTEIMYVSCEIYLSIIYEDEEITEIEISDMDF